MKPSVGNKRRSASDKPKRPMTPYNTFFKDQRKAILAQTGGHSGGFATLARTIAARWKAVSPEERFACTVKAAEDRARYKREMMLWLKEKRVQICTSEASSACLQPFGDGSAAGRGGGETCRDPLVFDRCPSSTPRSTSYTMRQEASLRQQRLDAVEIISAPMDVKVSAETERRRLPKTPKMDTRSNRVLPVGQSSNLRRQVMINSHTPNNLRSVFEEVAELDVDLPSTGYGSITLELDDAICLREY